jgi:hypothetical protein
MAKKKAKEKAKPDSNEKSGKKLKQKFEAAYRKMKKEDGEKRKGRAEKSSKKDCGCGCKK